MNLLDQLMSTAIANKHCFFNKLLCVAQDQLKPSERDLEEFQETKLNIFLQDFWILKVLEFCSATLTLSQCSDGFLG